MNNFDTFKEIKKRLMEREMIVKSSIKEIYECKNLNNLNILNSTIAQKIREQRCLIKELEKIQLDTRNDALKTELTENIEDFLAQLDNNYTVLKKANFFAKNKIVQFSKEVLFERKDQTQDENESGLRKRKGDAFLINKTNSITENLFQITKLMSEQVNQSDSALQALVSSSSTVTETQEEIKIMGSHLINSKTLLTKYGRRECTDKILIFLALGFFLACVLYVFTKRFFRLIIF